MTSDSPRNFNARIVPTCAAIALVLLGAWLRLHRLDAMEFKADEQEALKLSVALLADRPWLSLAAWPTHGMPSSNIVPLPPLYTWIIAALWIPTRDPVGVVALIAIGNTLCLYPLWRWARRRMDEGPALVTLAIAAVSPFTVIFSRKLWNLDVLLPGVLAALWGIEWLRSGRPWRGITLLLIAALWVGQVHLSGPIGMVLLPIAIGLQVLADHRRDPHATLRIGRPSARAVLAVGIAAGLLLIFWVPYLIYLAHLIPTGVLAERPKLAAMAPDLLVRIEAQVVPVDLISFFAPHRDEFLRDSLRAFCYYASVVVGAPLMVYGLWRWIRAPWTVPVFGIWWWLMVAAFAVARIPCHPSYVLTLAPITAMLPAGAFDAPTLKPPARRALWALRIGYVAVLLGLTVSTEKWLADRGGSAGVYGITYDVRMTQAETIVRARGIPSAAPSQVPAGLTCAALAPELKWLVRWVDPEHRSTPESVELCDGWIADGDRVRYRWTLRQ